MKGWQTPLTDAQDTQLVCVWGTELEIAWTFDKMVGSLQSNDTKDSNLQLQRYSMVISTAYQLCWTYCTRIINWNPRNFKAFPVCKYSLYKLSLSETLPGVFPTCTCNTQAIWRNITYQSHHRSSADTSSYSRNQHSLINDKWPIAKTQFGHIKRSQDPAPVEQTLRLEREIVIRCFWIVTWRLFKSEIFLRFSLCY